MSSRREGSVSPEKSAAALRNPLQKILRPRASAGAEKQTPEAACCPRKFAQIHDRAASCARMRKIVRMNNFFIDSRRRLINYSGMELRHHPLMNCGATRNWPPVWAQATKDGGKTAEGEIGILRYAQTDRRLSNKCFLVIEYCNERYNATLSFSDAKFFLLVTHLLKNHIGRTIKEIGDLDLSYSL